MYEPSPRAAPIAATTQRLAAVVRPRTLMPEACASGKHIPSAVLTLSKGGGDGQQEYLVVTLKDVFVTSYQTGGSGSDLPTDQISLAFNEIAFEYSTQRADGSLGEKTRASWNIKENKGI